MWQDDAHGESLQELNSREFGQPRLFGRLGRPSSPFQNRNRDFFSYFVLGNTTASVLIFFFCSSLPRFRFFFSILVLTKLCLPINVVFGQSKFRQNRDFDYIFYNKTKSNLFIQSMATLQLFFNWFEQAGTWWQADPPFSLFRFGNRPIKISVLISFPKPKTRFYKRDKNLDFGFGNEIRVSLIS